MARSKGPLTQHRMASLVAPHILRDVLRDYYNASGGNIEAAAAAFSKSYNVKLSGISYRHHMAQVGLAVERRAVEVETKKVEGKKAVQTLK